MINVGWPKRPGSKSQHESHQTITTRNDRTVRWLRRRRVAGREPRSPGCAAGASNEAAWIPRDSHALSPVGEAGHRKTNGTCRKCRAAGVGLADANSDEPRTIL